MTDWDAVVDTSGYVPRVVDASGTGSIGLPSNVNVDGFVWRSSTDYLMSFSGDTTITQGMSVLGAGRSRPTYSGRAIAAAMGSRFGVGNSKYHYATA